MIDDLKKIMNGLLQMAGWILFIAIWTGFGWLMGRCYEQREAERVKREAASRYEIRDTRYIPSIEEQQRYLASEGYDVGEIDGVAGMKFCRALNDWSQRQTFNQYAARCFTGSPAVGQRGQAPGESEAEK